MMNKIKQKRIELLSPAGNLEKLKTAIDFGADAVYIGGKEFSLRARANNFELSDIEEGVQYAHAHQAKVYVTCNVLPHQNELDDNKLINYLKELERIGVDAIIASSIHILDTCIQNCPKMEAHVSTQASVLNSLALKGYEEMGAKRVVLAREASLEEIAKIRKTTSCGIEVFIHGGMCSSFSGRCMLSNHMVNRDANRGGCAHSCRWNYDLIDNSNVTNEKINQDTFLNIGSKDLCAVDSITKLIEIGVDSLKIEGRMKSEYYIATIVRSYRKLIDEYYETHECDVEEAREEINRAENRLTSFGFLNGDVTISGQLYDRDDHPTKEFVGRVSKVNHEEGTITIIQRNYFTIDDTIEFFNKTDSYLWTVNAIYDKDNQPLDAARHPEQEIILKDIDLVSNVDVGYMMRLIKK